MAISMSRYSGEHMWYPHVTHPHISPFVKPICLPSLRCVTMKQPTVCQRDLSSNDDLACVSICVNTCSAVMLHVCLALLFVWQQSSTMCFDRATLARLNPLSQSRNTTVVPSFRRLEQQRSIISLPLSRRHDSALEGTALELSPTSPRVSLFQASSLLALAGGELAISQNLVVEVQDRRRERRVADLRSAPPGPRTVTPTDACTSRRQACLWSDLLLELVLSSPPVDRELRPIPVARAG